MVALLHRIRSSVPYIGVNSNFPPFQSLPLKPSLLSSMRQTLGNKSESQRRSGNRSPASEVRSENRSYENLFRCGSPEQYGAR
jgi:hypothetical protein